MKQGLLIIHVSLKYVEKREREREGIFSVEFHEKVSFTSSIYHSLLFFLSFSSDFINAPIIFLIKHFVSLVSSISLGN